MTETGRDDTLISSDEVEAETTVALDSGSGCGMPKSSLSNAEAGSMRSDISKLKPVSPEEDGPWVVSGDEKDSEAVDE